MNKPTNDSALVTDAWVRIRDAAGPGQPHRNYPQRIVDANGITYIVALHAVSTGLILTRKRGDVLIDERRFDLPATNGVTNRASGYGIGNDGKIVAYGHTDATTQPLIEFEFQIAGFAPITGGGGPPNPNPEPGPGGISAEQAREIARAVFGEMAGGLPTPADFVVAFTTALHTGGSQLNRDLENFFIAMFERHMGRAYANSYQIMQQLDNRVYATLLAHDVLQAAAHELGQPWPPPEPGRALDDIPTPAEVAVLAAQERMAALAAAEAAQPVADPE